MTNIIVSKNRFLYRKELVFSVQVSTLGENRETLQIA